MAEMVDASDLGSGFFGSGGSTPSMGIWKCGRTANAPDLKSGVRKDLWVRILPLP